jgi:hypothetical protein
VALAIGDCRLTIADFRVTSSEFGRWFFFRMTITGFRVPSGVHLRASVPDRKGMKADRAFFFFCGGPAYREEPITTGNAER